MHPKIFKIVSQRNICTPHVHGKVIYSIQEVATTKCPETDTWIKKKKSVYIKWNMIQPQKKGILTEEDVIKQMYMCKCHWVTLLYSRKLTECCKPAIKEKIKII